MCKGLRGFTVDKGNTHRKANLEQNHTEVIQCTYRLILMRQMFSVSVVCLITNVAEPAG